MVLKLKGEFKQVYENLENPQTKMLVRDIEKNVSALDEKIDEDLLEALAATSLNKAQHDARTLHLAMKVGQEFLNE